MCSRYRMALAVATMRKAMVPSSVSITVQVLRVVFSSMFRKRADQPESRSRWKWESTVAPRRWR